MAHGYLTPTDIRVDRNYLGAIASSIGNRIGKASDMARRERAYASKKAKDQDTTLKDEGMGGKGYFFKRALGSTFGGDRFARTRGRFESDPPAGRDPTSTQQGRFRGGFNYDFSKPVTGGALANIVSSAGGAGGSAAAAGFLGSGAQAINPEVLGGELAKYQGTKKNAAGFAVDTTATEVRDLAGILNQIGQLIVQTSNSTITAVDGVQRVNVRVVESIQSLAQLQSSIAADAMQQQRLLANKAEDHTEKMLAKQKSEDEKNRFTRDRMHSSLTAEKGYGFGGKGGGLLGGLFGGSPIGDMLGLASNFIGGRRGLGRMSRAGRAAQRRQGFSTAVDGAPGVRGMNFRDHSMTGSQLGRQRIMQGKGLSAGQQAGNDITKRYAQRYGEKAALKRFGAEGLEAAGMQLSKGGMLSRFLRPVFKRIPIFGGLIDFAVSLALGEPVGRAAAKAVGATLGAALGSLIPVPGVGTVAGGILGDFAGGAIYDSIAGSGSQSENIPAFASGGIVTKPTIGLTGEAGAEGIFPLEGKKGKDTFIKFGEGIIEAQRRNRVKYAKIQAEGLTQYYERQNGWMSFLNVIKNLGGQLAKWIFGDKANDTPTTPSTADLLGGDDTSPQTTNEFAPILPKGNPVFSSPFGQRDISWGSKNHKGIDIGVNAGSPVTSIADGTVKVYDNATWGSHGQAVVVDHGDGTSTLYGHVTPTVKDGDQVKKGDKIATVLAWKNREYGAPAGDNTHLHFERRTGGIGFQGTAVDPAAYLNDVAAQNKAQAQAQSKAEAERNERAATVSAFETKSKEAAALLKNDEAAGREGAVRIPGVGTVQRGRGWFGNYQNKFYTPSGQEVDEKTFMEMFKKRQGEIEKLRVSPDDNTASPAEISRRTNGDQAAAPVTSDVLQASAEVSRRDREAATATQVAFLSTPMPQQSNRSSSDDTLAVQASSSPRGWTPAGFHNAILEA